MVLKKMIEQDENLKSKEVLHKGSFKYEIGLIESFGFADQLKITNRLENNLDLKRADSDNVFFKDNGVAAAKVVVKENSGFVENFLPTPNNQQLVADHLLSKTTTDLFYKKRTVFKKIGLKNVTWTCEFGIENGKNILFCLNVVFMENDNIDYQTRDNSTFDWLPFSSAFCSLGVIYIQTFI